MVGKVRTAVGGSLHGRTIAVWGLAFKANTDDVRDSPAVAIVERLLEEGATVRAYDPQAHVSLPGLTQVGSALEACEGSDSLVVLTEWPEFIGADLEGVAARLRGKHVVDTRNVLDHRSAERAGLVVQGVGR
jgi:UDPglucose 6-dehydrogenase